jgi:DNA-binding CsgD family transcriptional regulator
MFDPRLRVSLRLRLFALLVLFAAAIMLVIAAILSASGVFSVGMSQSRMLLQNELSHISVSTDNSFETLTAEGIALSDRLQGRISDALKAQGATASGLRERPELLEGVLRECFDAAVAALDRNAASGVFVVLDATVNPETSSRAGLFIRNMEPNALNHSDPSFYYLRGPIVLARENHMYVLPQWTQEFPVAPGDFFHKAVEGAAGGLAPARSYYWNPAQTLAEDYDTALLLCVPIVAADGTVLGICGFEVNSILFKMQNLPDNSVFSRVFSVFAPLTEDGLLDGSMAMTSATYSVSLPGQLAMGSYEQGLLSFTGEGEHYVGLAVPLQLYSKNTVHNDEFLMAVLVPQEELEIYTARENGSLTILLVVLFFCAVGVAVFLSRRYLTPVTTAFEQIKRRDAEALKAVNVPEIDDLLDFLAKQDEEREVEQRKMKRKLARLSAAADEQNYIMPTPEAYAAFLKNLKTLTRTEREVFNLYMQGHRAKDMPALLYRSANTIKKHNQHIYDKLGISSRDELMGFMKMMKDKGDASL